MFNIVLHEPKIPQNTGNIARLCACTGSCLFLVGKLGFHITDKYVKRAGMDYWNLIKVERYETLDELKVAYADNNFYYMSTKAGKIYTDIVYKHGDFLVFGSETKGLQEQIILDNPDYSLKIPMLSDRRSLNLANSASIVLYEALRQNNFF